MIKERFRGSNSTHGTEPQNLTFLSHVRIYSWMLRAILT